MNWRTGQTHYLVHPKRNAQQFHDFLRQLLEFNSERKLVLVIDNASYHHTRAVLALLEDHADHVLVVWLPRYSPELNLIEGMWGYLKRSSLNNYFFGDVESLERAIIDTFAYLNQQPQTTLSLAYHSATGLRKSA